ncbi:EF-hand domain [Dillenia turbinata]|uniref:EF-hand domain n=1 Tax=Dillenia turbinata TaxID=194707 RepID=A0AAN8W9L3_9MAGN
MKLIKNISPKQLFRSKKSRSNISKPDPFGSGSSSDSSDIKPATPNSVLPFRSPETSSEWPDISADIHYQLVQAFKLIDRDGDGKITRRELEALLSRVGAEPPSEDELMTMLSEIDRDGDGCISLEEFGAISSAFAPPACGSELRDAFDFFDTDHDGKITAEELFAVFTSFGDDRCTLEDCRGMINGVDRNGDGFVCFEDFTRMMEQQR